MRENNQQMCKESERFSFEYTWSQKILSDRYQQEMNKATNNIREEVDKNLTPYLGETLSEPLTTIDLTTGDN